MNNVNRNIKVLWQSDSSFINKDSLYNEYRRKWFKNPENREVSTFPLFLDIEATSVCNLKCPNCVQTTTDFKKGFMDFELFKKIIDEASDNGCYGCKFHTVGRGEPLLHKDIVKMVAYAKKKGLIDVYINTNGILLKSIMIDNLLDAGIDMIAISIDGYTPAVYNKYRPNVNFSNLAYWIVPELYRRRDSGGYNTKIRIQTIKYSDIDLSGFVNFWRGVCDEITCLTYKEMKERKSLQSDWVCPQLWQRMGILYNGSVIPCNHDDRGLAILGNVNDTSILKLWNSSSMNFIRQTHIEGKAHFLGACDGCYLRISEIERERG